MEHTSDNSKEVEHLMETARLQVPTCLLDEDRRKELLERYKEDYDEDSN